LIFCDYNIYGNVNFVVKHTYTLSYILKIKYQYDKLLSSVDKL